MPVVYSKRWVAQNPEQFLELSKPPPACEICFEPFSAGSPACSPLLGDRATSCRHFACEDCWLAIMGQREEQWRCPQCRADLRPWLRDEFGQFLTGGVSLECIVEFVSAAMHELRDRPAFVATARRILQHLPRRT